MSVKKQTPSLCKLSSVYEKLLQYFLNGTDIDCYFYRKFFESFLSHLRLLRVNRGSNKKSPAIKFLQFCNSKIQQRYILQEEVNICKRELTYLVDSLRDFLKTFDHASKCIQIPLPKPKVDIGCTKSKNNLFALYYSDIMQNPNRQNRLSF